MAFWPPLTASWLVYERVRCYCTWGSKFELLFEEFIEVFVRELVSAEWICYCYCNWFAVENGVLIR
mgnify:CR=1 FL=1